MGLIRFCSRGQNGKHIRIGDFAMPWETHDKITSIPKGYVRWYEWAYRPDGIKQVGCIYTAQEFEFDYVGVIIGNDLCVDKRTGKISADISATKDPMLRRSPENLEKHIKNTYRTLLTRGIQGCFVYFTDKEPEDYLSSIIEVLLKLFIINEIKLP